MKYVTSNSNAAKSLLFLLVYVLTGCAYLEPFIQDYNIISVPEEKQIGDQMKTEISKKMALVEDARTARVRSIGNKMANALPRRDFTYSFYLVNDKTPNAFTIPGASIYVHTGLLNLVSDESELAGVMAHEIGHAYERHPAKGLSRALGLQNLSQLVFKDPKGDIKKMALQIAQGGLLSRYGRGDENEADSLAYELVRKTGYDEDGLLRFLKKIQKLETGSGNIPFLSSHPPTPERIGRLESLKKSFTTCSSCSRI